MGGAGGSGVVGTDWSKGGDVQSANLETGAGVELVVSAENVMQQTAEAKSAFFSRRRVRMGRASSAVRNCSGSDEARVASIESNACGWRVFCDEGPELLVFGASGM